MCTAIVVVVVVVVTVVTAAATAMIGYHSESWLLNDCSTALLMLSLLGTDSAQNLSEEVDVHAVSGCLKLYFREMPQPLFPRAMYTKFVEGLGK